MNHQTIAVRRYEPRRLSLPARLLGVFLLSAGCDTPTAPSDTALATFRVAGEMFRVQLVGQSQIDAARAAQNGGSAQIPLGRIVAGSGVNTGWSWHLVDVEFVEAGIEVCDGRPSDVERQGVGFGEGRFCPWSARVVAISRD
jgi:hypothetical protein